MGEAGMRRSKRRGSGASCMGIYMVYKTVRTEITDINIT
jgi:hypothetical protein